MLATLNPPRYHLEISSLQLDSCSLCVCEFVRRTKMVFSNEERAFILKDYFAEKSYSRETELFQLKFLDRPHQIRLPYTLWFITFERISRLRAVTNRDQSHRIFLQHRRWQRFKNALRLPQRFRCIAWVNNVVFLYIQFVGCSKDFAYFPTRYVFSRNWNCLIIKNVYVIVGG